MINSPIEQSGAVKPSSLEQQVYEGDLFAQRITEIPSNMKKRFAYDGSGNCIYIGYAPTGLSEGADGWLLWKLTYDVSNQCTAIDIAYGNWTARTGYTYA